MTNQETSRYQDILSSYYLLLISQSDLTTKQKSLSVINGSGTLMISLCIGIDTISVPACLNVFSGSYGITNMDLVFITYNYLLNRIEKPRCKQNESNSKA